MRGPYTGGYARGVRQHRINPWHRIYPMPVPFPIAFLVGTFVSDLVYGPHALSAIMAGVLIVTGWMGGELAYRYKVGVIEGEP